MKEINNEICTTDVPHLGMVCLLTPKGEGVNPDLALILPPTLH